jgi:Bifunctional DNA primase/polymerase, N-terminal
MTRPTLLSASPPVEGLDEFGGGQVADPMPGVDGGVAEGQQQVGLAASRGSDEAEVLGGRPWQPGRRAARCRLPGTNAYVVAPPSQHPSGVRYRWIIPGGLAPAPSWLLELVRPQRELSAAGQSYQ